MERLESGDGSANQIARNRGVSIIILKRSVSDSQKGIASTVSL